MLHVIATTRPWHAAFPERLSALTGHEFCLISSKSDLTYDRLSELRPHYIFFPHWSYIIPPEIFKNFECVIFHMTDVPFGRGGSPLQNLIARGIYETRISALKCEAQVDAGPVYMKRPLSLHGSAEEIYLRAADAVAEMIVKIVQNEPIPVEQQGKVICFQRRRPEEGNLAQLKDLRQVFDYIRMLDAEGYPKAFLDTEHFRLEFERASLKQDYVQADVKITRKQLG